MNAEGHPWRVVIQKPTDRENAVQAIVDINGTALAPPAATGTIMSWTVSAFPMLSIHKPVVHEHNLRP